MTIPLLTASSKDVVKQDESQVLQEKAYLTSVKCQYSLRQYTLVTDAGPVMVGLAHSDYTASEIEEWIENAGSWTQGDKRTQEIARRFIRRIGTFDNPTLVTESDRLNEGRPIHTKCGWQLTTGQTVAFWVYNLGTADLVTGADVLVSGFANLWPN